MITAYEVSKNPGAVHAEHRSGRMITAYEVSKNPGAVQVQSALGAPMRLTLAIGGW